MCAPWIRCVVGKEHPPPLLLTRCTVIPPPPPPSFCKLILLHSFSTWIGANSPFWFYSDLLALLTMATTRTRPSSPSSNLNRPRPQQQPKPRPQEPLSGAQHRKSRGARCVSCVYLVVYICLCGTFLSSRLNALACNKIHCIVMSSPIHLLVYIFLDFKPSKLKHRLSNRIVF